MESEVIAADTEVIATDTDPKREQEESAYVSRKRMWRTLQEPSSRCRQMRARPWGTNLWRLALLWPVRNFAGKGLLTSRYRRQIH